MPTQRRHPITHRQKAALRAHRRAQPHLNNLQLIQWFKDEYGHELNPSTVSRTLSHRYSDLDNPSNERILDFKRSRPEHWPELEKVLVDWTKCAEGRANLSSKTLREKAKQFWPVLYPDKEMPTFSNGWMHSFQIRRGIQFRRKRRETRNPGEDADAEMATILSQSQGCNEQREVDEALHLFPYLFPQFPAADAWGFLGRSQVVNGAVAGQSQGAREPAQDQSHVAHEPVEDQSQEIHEPVGEVDDPHTPPKVSAAEALERLRLLLLYEEQQEDANQEFIEVLRRHESVILERTIPRKRQVDIRRYFRQT